MNNRLLNICLIGLFVVLPVLIGCGGSKIKTGKVTGMVTLDGKPLEDGRLTFVATEGRDGFADIQNGQIVNATTLKSGDGISLGIVKIAVFSQKSDGMITVKGDEDPTQTFTMEKKISRIPLKYTNPDTSGITHNIESGENNITIELKSK